MARLCKIEELYNFKCGDYLLWFEGKHSLYPCSPAKNSKEIYSWRPTKDYIAFGATWHAIDEYNKTWRIWEGKPTQDECMKEHWNEEG